MDRGTGSELQPEQAYEGGENGRGEGRGVMTPRWPLALDGGLEGEITARAGLLGAETRRGGLRGS